MAGPDHHEDAAPDEGPDDFEREIELIRSLGSDPVELSDAPPDLWARLAAEAGVEAGSPRSDTPVRSVDVPSPAAPSPLAPSIPVLDDRRRRRTAVLASAAAVLALVVGIGVLTVVRSDTTPTELAAAELVPYDGAEVGEAAGQVELVDDGGRLSLRVDMRDLPAPAAGTYYELWLIDPSTGEPVSVATMKDGSSDVTTDVVVPEGTDTDRYDVVDVSVQVEGAGPAHSGNSVLRGTLS